MAEMDSNRKDEEKKGLLRGKELSRRDFLKVAGAAGATIGLATGLGGLVAACEEKDTGTTVSVSDGGAVETGREIKIGFVAPITGPLSLFGEPDQYCVERAQEAFGDGIVCGDGKKHPVKIILMDSQSDTNRASTVTGDLILNEGVDLITAASTPDTVSPVAEQCEANGMPCITNDAPWQSYIASRGNRGDITQVFKWTYHTFWGLEDVQANFLDMWSQVPNNGKVAAMFPNDNDGNAWLPGWAPVWEPNNLTAIIPPQFQNLSEDFTAQISQFKTEGCEIGMGVFLPPDFTNFWNQRAQQGWNPKLGTYAKALLFPGSIEALGDVGVGLTTEVWWMPTHPFTSPLLNETCQQFADEYTRRTSKQWTQPLLHFIVFEMAWDALKRATSVDDKEAILAAIKTTKMDTIGGKIDFTEPVVGPTPPFKVGPCHIVENVYKTPQVGGQWRKGTTWPYELTVCSKAGVPDGSIPTQDTVEPLA